MNRAGEDGLFLLPKINFQYNSFEPFLSEKATEIHYAKHHQTYVNKLNDAIKKYPDLTKKSVEEILFELENIPEDIKTPVKNHGGGHANHSLYWSILNSSSNNLSKPSKDLLSAIENEFGSFEQMKDKLTETAVNFFGSGWGWLVLDKNQKLILTTTQNQETPLSKKQIPLVTIDVWEHAYYIDFQNRRPDFVKILVNERINWDAVSQRYDNAKDIFKSS